MDTAAVPTMTAVSKLVRPVVAPTPALSAGVAVQMVLATQRAESAVRLAITALQELHVCLRTEFKSVLL
jgi:hypothetical protein